MNKHPILVPPDYSELLKQAHRRWMETRDPKDGDRFADFVWAAAKAYAAIRTP